VRRSASTLLTLALASAIAAEARSEELDRGARAKSGSAAAYADVRPRPLAQIPPGTVIGEGTPKGWSQLVLLARPRLGVGDVDTVPKAAARYSNIFLFTVLARVRDSAAAGDDPHDFYLEQVAVGGAIDVGGRTIVATSDQTFGKDLGFIGRRVYQESENLVATDFRQVARTRTMVVFDANAYVLYNRKHTRMVIRHAIVASPRDGRISTFIWLLGSDGQGGYALAEPTLQLLPAGLREDRVMSVDGRKFGTFGVPGPDAFAVARIPQGTPVKFSAALSSLAVVKRFDAAAAVRLESELQARYAPLAARAALPGMTRR
jgi:hypothetical protein